MTSTELRDLLKTAAISYAGSNKFLFEEHGSAILFHDLGYNFFPDSFEAIKKNDLWKKRTLKAHTQVPGRNEMQSSNSSDALLMSIFCHPKASSWKGLRDLLKVGGIEPKFGDKQKIEGAPRDSEIDMAIEDVLFEAKLTETDFTRKEEHIVEQYVDLDKYFHKESLARSGKEYENYQVIRNLLAALQAGKRHILLCDERRPDLLREYMETVCCLKELQHRRMCRVVFWQEIAGVCGKDLRRFLEEKYLM